LQKQYTYDYPRPSVTVDIVLFRLCGGVLNVLLVKRGREPFKGTWVFPGGFVDIDERVGDAAVRELREETAVQHVVLEPFAVFDDPKRDPRGRTISVAHAGLLLSECSGVQAGDDAADAMWFPVNDPPPLGFDHVQMLASALAWLAERLGVVKREPPWPPGMGIDERRAFREALKEMTKGQDDEMMR